MKQKKKIVWGILIVAGILVYLLITGFSSGGYQLTIKEIVTGDFEGKYVETEGYLVQNSVEWNSEKLELTFVVKDDDGSNLAVYYNDVAPDNFYYEDAKIILKGVYDLQKKVFIAEKVQTRCPSTYEAVE